MQIVTTTVNLKQNIRLCTGAKLALLLIIMLGLWSVSTWANADGDDDTQTNNPEIRVRQVSTALHDNIYYLDSLLCINLGDAAEEALYNGVRLVFAVEIRIFNLRWRHLKREVAFLSQQFSLRYHTLSRQYSLLNINTQSSANFQTLSEAIYHLETLAGIPLIDKTMLNADEDHFIEIRARLLLDSLPLPLRTTAWFSGAWSLNSGWSVWALKE